MSLAPLIAYATLSDLPSDLLLEIFMLCDNETLINIGITCHALHFISLHTFFKRSDIRDPLNGYLTAYRTPSETLPAIYRALFIQNLRHVDFYFNPDPNRLFKDVYAMHAMFARFTSVKVELHLPPVGRWLSEEGFKARGTVDSGKWGRAFMGLVDEAVKKGCKELQVTGGLGIANLYRNSGDVRPAGMVQTQSQVALMKPIPEITTTGLDKLWIHSDMLLQHPFIPWTISTINASSTLSILSIKTPKIQTETWTKVLSSLTLSSLRKLEILVEHLGDPRSSPEPLDVLNFLTRHRKIEGLVLSGVIPPAPSLKLREPILPCLKRLTAHPCYVSLILSSMELNPEALPILDSVTISSEFDRWSPSNHQLFDNAIRSVGNLERKVTLGLHFTCQPNSDWFSRYSPPSTSPDDNPLVHITALVLSFHCLIPNPLLYCLPKWLSALPSLETVKFAGHWNVEKMKEIGFEKMLARSPICERGVLRWFVDQYGVVVDLAQVRKKFEAEGELDRQEA